MSDPKPVAPAALTTPAAYVDPVEVSELPWPAPLEGRTNLPVGSVLLSGAPLDIEVTPSPAGN